MIYTEYLYRMVCTYILHLSYNNNPSLKLNNPKDTTLRPMRRWADYNIGKHRSVARLSIGLVDNRERELWMDGWMYEWVVEHCPSTPYEMILEYNSMQQIQKDLLSYSFFCIPYLFFSSFLIHPSVHAPPRLICSFYVTSRMYVLRTVLELPCHHVREWVRFFTKLHGQKVVINELTSWQLEASRVLVHTYILQSLSQYSTAFLTPPHSSISTLHTSGIFLHTPDGWQEAASTCAHSIYVWHCVTHPFLCLQTPN